MLDDESKIYLQGSLWLFCRVFGVFCTTYFIKNDCDTENLKYYTQFDLKY